ncbi:MAG: branched-chain amino acid ABC transporter ATP-binding protein [Deltaproteobacteria bacterium]|nr:MAG: branched-chain amino acid ABC transporter ATP-binding protein [Deltaproteobacteria bacterium]
MLLRVENLNVFYGDMQALWDVNFEVGEGELVTLVGANGAGKTTTINALSGLLRQKTGKIYFKDTPIHEMEPHEITALGIVQVPEGRKLWPNLTVLENLELGAFLKANRREKDENMSRVYDLFPRLKEREKQLAGTLSGGEQQMLAIGRAMMSRPEILMLDEPSLGLAPILVKDLFKIIRRINEQGVTVLLVEQNLRYALENSTRGYVLETGKVTLAGPSSELLENPHVKKAYLGI